MKKIIHILATLLAALLLATRLPAQTFDNITIADASTVCSIVQDKLGTIWLGTERGLYSYDGYHTIPHNTADDGSALTARVHTMLMQDYNIFLGTERGLLVYDIRGGHYTHTAENSPSDIRAICMQGGRLWIGSAQGLYSMGLSDGRLKHESARLHNIYALAATKHGLLIGTINGLYIRHRDGNIRQIRIGDGQQPLVNAIKADDDRTGNATSCHEQDVWIGTEGALYLYDWHKLTSKAHLEGNSIKSLAQYGNMLYAGTDNGLYIYNTRNQETTHALHDSRSARSIGNNIVWTVMTDCWGNVWTGTDQGVSAIYRKPFLNYTPLSDITQTGDGNCLHLISRGAGNTIWLGGTNGLIGYKASHGFMPDEKGHTTWFRQTSATHYMSHNRVRRVYNDNDGTTIVCTDHGLNIYDLRTRQMRNIIITDPSRRFTTAWAYDIVDDGYGRYWVCSYMGGIFIIGKEKLLNATSGMVVADRHLLKELQGIHVWQLVKDGRGCIWARMYDRGLDRIDTRTMRVEHVVGKERVVNDFCTDSKGNVWAAMDGEIKCFGMNAADNQSFAINGHDNNDAALLCEADNGIWALAGQECLILGKNGMSARFALPGFRPFAICYDQLSRCILLGGNDAVASISTNSIKESANNRRYTFFLSGILVDGKAFVPGNGYPTFIDKLKLNARQNNITLQFTDLPMSGMPARVYAYKLDGIDHKWQYMNGETHDISYSALPPGDYQLYVRLVDGQGNARKQVYSLSMTILPPWYLSTWAKILYWLAVIGLTVAAMKFYMMRKRLHEEHEAKERIMQESAARSQFFDNMSNQMRQPLGKLLATILSLLNDETNTKNAQRLEQIRHSTRSINSIVYHAFDMQQNMSASTTGIKSAIDIVDFCRRAADDARMKYGKTVEIVFRTQLPSAYVNVDIVRMQSVFDELIDFAANNRKEDNGVSVDIKESGNKVGVAVGIPGLAVGANDMPLIFNRYFSIAAENTQLTAGVNTLALINEFAKQNGAIAKAENSSNGLVVTIEFDMFMSEQSAETSTTATQRRDQQTVIAATDNSADARLLSKITDTIEAHIADSDFNVTRLQETLGLGSKLLYRKVKQMTGKTPVEFIRHIRMQRAAILLREGRFSVSEVMYMVGFSNSSYFSKCFQKAYGITPAEYSKKS